MHVFLQVLPCSHVLSCRRILSVMYITIYKMFIDRLIDWLDDCNFICKGWRTGNHVWHSALLLQIFPSIPENLNQIIQICYAYKNGIKIQITKPKENKPIRFTLIHAINTESNRCMKQTSSSRSLMPMKCLPSYCWETRRHVTQPNKWPNMRLLEE